MISADGTIQQKKTVKKSLFLLRHAAFGGSERRGAERGHYGPPLLQ